MLACCAAGGSVQSEQPVCPLQVVLRCFHAQLHLDARLEADAELLLVACLHTIASLMGTKQSIPSIAGLLGPCDATAKDGEAATPKERGCLLETALHLASSGLMSELDYGEHIWAQAEVLGFFPRFTLSLIMRLV